MRSYVVMTMHVALANCVLSIMNPSCVMHKSSTHRLILAHRKDGLCALVHGFCVSRKNGTGGGGWGHLQGAVHM